MEDSKMYTVFTETEVYPSVTPVATHCNWPAAVAAVAVFVAGGYQAVTLNGKALSVCVGRKHLWVEDADGANVTDMALLGALLAGR